MNWSGLPNRIEAKIVPEPNSGCWLWVGNVCNKGYGCVNYKKRAYRVHRLAYEFLCEPVPAGLQLDHLCRVRCCVNPDHLEPVTLLENVRRGNSGKFQRSKLHCPQGHPYNNENTALTIRPDGSYSRYCKTCKMFKIRARRAAGADV